MFAVMVAESKFRRDGRFIEKLGYYQPILKDSDPYRIKIDSDRYNYWVQHGAQPTKKVLYLAAKQGIIEFEKKEFTNIKKATPKAKAQERMNQASKVEREAQA